MKILTEHITQQLKERAFCVVFEGDLQRCWPSSGMSQAERERKIQDYAESQGWTAAMLEAGLVREQYFKRPEPGIDGGVDLISVALPFGRLWYGEPNAVYNAIEYAKHRSRSFRAVIRVYDETGNVIETHALLENSRSTKRRLSR